MTVKQAIKVLKKHNNWRRGGKCEQQSGKVIGEAIDIAILAMEIELKNEPKIAFKEGQKNPEIKKLEWKYERIGGTDVKVFRTPFGNYEIREYDWGCILFGISSAETAPNFKTVEEAVDKAQEHFNQKVMEYIETKNND